jgi:hypothetical protein
MGQVMRRIFTALVVGAGLTLTACSSGATTLGQPTPTAPSDLHPPKVWPSLATIRGQYLADVAPANQATDKLNSEMHGVLHVYSNGNFPTGNTNLHALPAYFPPVVATYQAEYDRLAALSWQLQDPKAKQDVQHLLQQLQGRLSYIQSVVSLGPNPPQTAFQSDVHLMVVSFEYAGASAAVVREDIGLPEQ